ncbi:hypothetical protein B296_00048848, partial [Ensete ventricosum]
MKRSEPPTENPCDSTNAVGVRKHGTATTGTVTIGAGRGLAAGEAMAPARSCENDRPSTLAGDGDASGPPPATAATRSSSECSSATEDDDAGGDPVPVAFSRAKLAFSSAMEASRSFLGFRSPKPRRG